MRFVVFAAVSLIACSEPPAALQPTPGEPHQGGRRSAESAAPVASAAQPASSPPGELDIDPARFDLAANPDLAARIAESPHGYFRFVGHQFAASVCKRFEKEAKSAPRVRLHGDPHVEQYAVTELGRWISDYDDASVGPAVIDLVRFGTSTILAARERGLSATETDALLGELFRGYADGLQNKPLSKEAPAFAADMSAKFAKDRSGFLAGIDKNILPGDASDDEFCQGKLEEYVGTLKKLGKAPKSAVFFSVKKMGRVKLGIGSALTKKYLLRLEGPSKKADDDVILEFKEVADLSQVPCVSSLPGGAAIARAQLDSAGGERLLAPMLLPDGRFWVNEWLANYQEAKLKKLRAEDLKPLVYEAALMLGREHAKPLPDGPAPSPDALEPKQADIVALEKAMKEMADATTHGWERFSQSMTKKTQ